MSYMERIAKVFRVEIGERFEIVSRYGDKVIGTFWFDEKGLYDEDGVPYFPLFCELMNEECKIVKRPWRPKDGEEYWSVDIDGVEGCTKFCKENQWDIMAYNFGNCFKTYEEANAHAEEMVEKMKAVLDGDVK
jgi:hypothetical protein